MRIERDLVVVEGPDASSYLQGQLSQDVEQLAIGERTFSLVLEPQGKVAAWMRATRTAPDRFELDVDAGHGAALVERLERFLLRTKATVTAVGSVAVDVSTDLATTDMSAGVVLADVFRDPHAEAVADPGWRETWDEVRVALGIPAAGTELDDGTIPEEAGIVDASVSFTKGCYTGQELVARIDSRGRNVPRRLRRIRSNDGALPAAGAALSVDGDVVGRLTTVVGNVALGYVGRKVDPGAAVVVDGGGVASVEELPPLR